MTYGLDGTVTESGGAARYRFDRAICSSDGEYVVSYEQGGTKGLVLKNERYIREINRSYYHADRYEYPVAIFKWIDGRTVLAHCPEEYCRLELEEIETGKRVISRESKSMDIFHSRLQANIDGRYLLSAGWVWQPEGVTWVYDLQAAAQRPEILDEGWKDHWWEGIREVNSAAFLGTDRMVLAGDDDFGSETKDVLCVYDLKTNKLLSRVTLAETPGIMMPIGDYVMSFFKYPKLIEISTGNIVHQWQDIPSGSRGSCFINEEEPAIHVALNPVNKRFAVGNSESITVIALGD